MTCKSSCWWLFLLSRCSDCWLVSLVRGLPRRFCASSAHFLLGNLACIIYNYYVIDRLWLFKKFLKPIYMFNSNYSCSRLYFKIKDYSKQLNPLYELIKESSPWNWNFVAEETFEFAKKHLSSTPVLIFPDDENRPKKEQTASRRSTSDKMSGRRFLEVVDTTRCFGLLVNGQMP